MDGMKESPSSSRGLRSRRGDEAEGEGWNLVGDVAGSAAVGGGERMRENL